MELEYVNVNEEGEEYDVHSTAEDALTVLSQFPNDTIVIRYKKPEPQSDEEPSDDDALDLRDQLENLLDRFDELLTVAEAQGYRAVQHKLEEASGPLSSAREAAEQYGIGVLHR